MFHKTTDSGFTLELKNHHKFNIVCFNLSCYTLQKCEVYGPNQKHQNLPYFLFQKPT